MINIPQIKVRHLSLGDDLNQVARLIYYTDEYIFPYLFDNDIKKGILVLADMVKNNTIYNYNNVTAGFLHEKIVGIVISQNTPITIDLHEMANCFVRCGVSVGDRFAKVYNEYYKLLEDEPDGIYIANVCVDKLYRKMGFAKAMLNSLLDDKNTYRLETVKDNVGALHLYQSLGFEIDCEYPGFTEVPCYRMTRKSKIKGD